jgi:tRNA (cytidine/uridine-2'-O-)-methyltransferase
VRLAVYQPDMPPNLGTLLRTGACLGVPVDVIEPCGFPFSERNFRRAAMDYLRSAVIAHHRSWEIFQREHAPGRLVLLTTRGDAAYCDFRYRADDILLVGQESRGVPPEVQAAADARVSIPLLPGQRSLNVAIAAAMVLGEALRQTAAFPPWPAPRMVPPR